IGLAENDKRYGKQGPYLIDAGISSSYHIAKFFGVTDWIRQPKPVVESPSARLIPLVSPISSVLPSLSRILRPKASETKAAEPATIEPKPADSKSAEPKRETRRASVDVAAVIDRALQAAGLKK
ncbi:MAG: poly(3-hydroxybutyrate) depolymerase, partial [Bradyrhizobium sp.]